MRVPLIMTFVLFIASNLPGGAQIQGPIQLATGALKTGIHQDLVEIGLLYRGHLFFLFGRVPPATTGLVAVLESAHNPPLKLVRKGRVLGLWFGVKEFEVGHLPALYMVNLYCPQCNALKSCNHEDYIREFMHRLDDYGGVGYESLRRHAVVKLLHGEPGADDEEVLWEGLLRLKEKAGLYAIRPNSIHLEAEGTFYHSFAIPDNAPEGRYRVTTYVLGKEGVLGVKADEVFVRHVGLVASLGRMARYHALGYGLLTVGVALAVGLLAGAMFKKGSGH